MVVVVVEGTAAIDCVPESADLLRRTSLALSKICHHLAENQVGGVMERIAGARDRFLESEAEVGGRNLGIGVDLPVGIEGIIIIIISDDITNITTKTREETLETSSVGRRKDKSEIKSGRGAGAGKEKRGVAIGAGRRGGARVKSGAEEGAKDAAAIEAETVKTDGDFLRPKRSTLFCGFLYNEFSPPVFRFSPYSTLLFLRTGLRMENVTSSL